MPGRPPTGRDIQNKRASKTVHVAILERSDHRERHNTAAAYELVALMITYFPYILAIIFNSFSGLLPLPSASPSANGMNLVGFLCKASLNRHLEELIFCRLLAHDLIRQSISFHLLP